MTGCRHPRGRPGLGDRGDYYALKYCMHAIKSDLTSTKEGLNKKTVLRLLKKRLSGHSLSISKNQALFGQSVFLRNDFNLPLFVNLDPK